MVLKRNYNSKMFFENIQEYVNIHTTNYTLSTTRAVQSRGWRAVFYQLAFKLLIS